MIAAPEPLDTNVPQFLVSYPAQPTDGGNLFAAAPKAGAWFYEPLYRGRRVFVHVPSGIMYNPSGSLVPWQPVYEKALSHLRQFHHEWLDCVALNLGLGSLIVLDNPTLDGRPYHSRRAILERDFLMIATTRAPKDTGVYLPMSLLINDQDSEQALWSVLRRDNQALRKDYALKEDFYLGFIAKRADAFYPNTEQPTPDWIAYRWR